MPIKINCLQKNERKSGLLTLLFCFAVIGQVLGQQPPFYNMIHPYVDRPTPAALSALLLLYQPPLLDILPMYLVFLLLTPLVIPNTTKMIYYTIDQLEK